MFRPNIYLNNSQLYINNQNNIYLPIIKKNVSSWTCLQSQLKDVMILFPYLV